MEQIWKKIFRERMNNPDYYKEVWEAIENELCKDYPSTEYIKSKLERLEVWLCNEMDKLVKKPK